MKPVTIDYDLLSIRCKMKLEEFNHPDFGEYVPLIREGYDSYSSFYDAKTKTTTRIPKHVDDEETFYIFKDNGAKILAVAHLDTVVSVESNWTFERAVLGNNRNKETMIFNAQLDDRLGAYILLDLLPLFLGNNAYDILLTNDEECSASTAADFIPPEGKSYNWIFQFDRRGTGAVLYDYDDATWRATVGEYLQVHTGSYSDICKLYKLGVKGVNVGTGYHDEHMDLCYMIEDEVISQVEKFVRFFKKNCETRFPHVQTTRSFRGWDSDDWQDYNYKSGSYWDGSAWVDRTASTFDPNGDWESNRWPPTSGSTLVTGAPKQSGLQRIHSRPLNESDGGEEEEETDDDTYDPRYDRDYVGQNELKMLAAVAGSMENYDTDGNYVGTSEMYIKAAQYESLMACDWFELPAVTKYNVLYQYEDCEQYPPTLIPIYQSRVNGKKCTYCKACSIIYDLDDIFWTDDSVPICLDCLETITKGTLLRTTPPNILSKVEDIAWEVHLTDHQIQWLAEGGGIRINKNGVRRSFVGVDDKVERCYCSICGQPEWVNSAVNFSNPLFKADDKAEVCRECFDIYQQDQKGI